MSKLYRYFLVGNFRDVDTLPVVGMVSYDLFRSKPPVSSIGCHACGEAVYDRRLEEDEIARCHLVPAPV